MGTASKQPTKKPVQAPARKVSRCPVCNKLVLDMSKHIGKAECK